MFEAIGAPLNRLVQKRSADSRPNTIRQSGLRRQAGHRDHERTHTFQEFLPYPIKGAPTAKYYVGTSSSRPAPPHQMPAEDLVSNHSIKVLMVGTA